MVSPLPLSLQSTKIFILVGITTNGKMSKIILSIDTTGSKENLREAVPLTK
jgi:hypothetical protein